MRFCRGEEMTGCVGKLVSEKHQVGPHGIDLTVACVYTVKKEGAIDFGGSEANEALVEKLEPVKKDPGDKYGWWNLTAGEYIVEFNEKVVIPDGCIGVIQPLARTLGAGVVHSTFIITSGQQVDRTVLIVGKSGFRVKENARISSLMGVKTD